MLSLVERLRDVVPGKNTVLYLDEILPLASNWIIINDVEPKEKVDLGFAEINASMRGDYEFISTEPVETQVLGSESFDEPLAKEIKKLETELQEYRYKEQQVWETSQHLDNPWKSPERKEFNNNIRPKIDPLERKIQNKKIHFEKYRPTTLSERIRNSELILVPERLLGKLESEFPEQNFGIIEDRSNPDFKLYKKLDKKNRVRVALKNIEDYKEESEERIDKKTRKLLFGMGLKEDRHDMYGLSMGSLYDLEENKLPQQFKMRIPGNAWLEIERSKTEIMTGQQVFRSLLLGEIGDMSFLDYDKYEARNEGGKVFFKEPSNFYHLGGSYNGYKLSRNNTVEDLVKHRKSQAQKKYNELWFEPMESIEEANDRLLLLEELVENREYGVAIRTISKHIGEIYEPFIHLNSLAEHITSNLLHSKWGAPIRKPEFYNDFMEIKDYFIKGYERISESLDSLTSTSREMTVAINSLSEVIYNELLMKKTYTFLKQVTEENPVDFLELQLIFQHYLQEVGAKKLDELETYQTGDRHKSSEFKNLMGRFQSQNPISSSSSVLDLISVISSKLIAYSSQAEFIKQNGWIKPELVDSKEGVVDIKQGWYPLTELQHTHDFVCNDTYLDLDKRIEIIDGPNVAGKTVDMKKTLMITMLAMSGNYVPAEYAKISFFDKLRFRLKNSGMNDNSALYAELKDLQPVMDSIGTPILVGLDEIGTSTNDLEGEAIAWGIVKRFSQAQKSHLIISSHYPTLSKNVKRLAEVKQVHYEFEKTTNYQGEIEIKFPHKKKLGPLQDYKYGLAVAESQNFDKTVISFAKERLNERVERFITGTL